jgi:outer membrane protein, adhesin transport system
MNNSFKKIVLLIGGLFLLHSHFVSANTLRDAVVRTIETNPDVLYGIKGWLASEQGIYKARGGYFPKIDVVAEVGEQNSKNFDTDFDYKRYTASGAGISLRQLVFDGLATSSLVASNKSHTLAAKYQVVGMANDVALLASKAYLDVLTTSKIVSLAQDNYAMTQDIAKVAKHRGDRADISLVRGRVALAKADLLAAQNNYADAKTVYYRIVGVEPLNLVMPNELIDSALPSSRDVVVKNALAIHPMLKSAESSINEALAQYRGSKANYYPRVDAVLRAGTDKDMYGVDGNQVGEEAMLQLSYNLFKGGSDVANQKQVGYLVGQSQKSRDIIYNKVVENAKLSWDELTTAREQISFLKQHSNAAGESAASYYQEYKKSKRSLVDVLNTQLESYKSKVSYLEGQSNVLFSKYWVLNSEGRLLSYFQIFTDIASSAAVIVTRPPEVKMQPQLKSQPVVKTPIVVKQQPNKQVVAPKIPIVTEQPNKQVVAPKAHSVQESKTASYNIADTYISQKALSKYTIQLYSSHVKDDAIDFIVKNHIQEKAAFYITKEENRDKYVVVYGSYVDKAAAELAIKAISNELRSHHPVVRQLNEVRAEL